MRLSSVINIFGFCIFKTDFHGFLIKIKSAKSEDNYNYKNVRAKNGFR